MTDPEATGRDPAPLRLRDGSRVCIVGGGPAGSFSAILLQGMARDRGTRLEVVLFEGRGDAPRCGHATCKGCAGIVSTRALESMRTIGIDLPEDVVLEEVCGYVLHIPHLPRDMAYLSAPEPGQRIVSVYRGFGPRSDPPHPIRSFDHFLRQTAAERGTHIVYEPVRSVQWADGRPVVLTDAKHWGCDLVVLATGVNARPPMGETFHYRPPRTATMFQQECPRPETMPEGRIGAFFGQPSDVVFATLVPKRDLVNVSLLGKVWDRSRREALASFLASPVGWLDQFFPQAPERLCTCSARVVVGGARRYYGDRWVAVGDAAVSRLYKDGIGSACRTSLRAMETAVNRGVAARDFRRGYAPYCRRVSRNNATGRLLFWLFARILARRLLAVAAMRSIRREEAQAGSTQRLSAIVWGMLTGDYTYLHVLRMLLSPATIARYAADCLAVALRRNASPDGRL